MCKLSFGIIAYEFDAVPDIIQGGSAVSAIRGVAIAVNVGNS
jgi:hypothetical protein